MARIPDAYINLLGVGKRDVTMRMHIITSDSAWKWIYGLGGPGLILLGIADNAPFISVPAGSVDVFVILLSASRHQWWFYYAFMATVGEVLGGYWAFRLAERVARKR